MSNIMNQCGSKSYLRLMFSIMPSSICLYIAPDYLHQLSCNIERTNTVREPSVSRAGENEFREPELAYATKSLKRLGLDYPPERLLKLPSIKFNEVMERITNPCG